MKYPIEVEEKRIIKRITIKQAVADFLNAFNVERGLVYTIKLLFLNPGKLIRNYLEEGRFKIVNAFRLLIITTALSLIVLYVSGLDIMISEFTRGFNEGMTEKEFSSQSFQQLFSDYYNLFLWISIPCYGLVTFLLFRKSSYNYAEHIVANSFYVSGINIIYCFMLPLTFFLTLNVAFILVWLLSAIYYFVLFSQFIRSRSIAFFIRAIAAFILGNILYVFVLSLIITLFIDVGMIK
ncbi:DUF3667 domain-containing protein [Ekhidna sp.]|uniref:DUF3667 domain-containing protein n=1 Tax=Ekhidna sp. TaxID=2608089 RepID=UPI003B50D328